MPDPITRLNAALEGRYRIERELGEGVQSGVRLRNSGWLFGVWKTRGRLMEIEPNDEQMQRFEEVLRELGPDKVRERLDLGRWSRRAEWKVKRARAYLEAIDAERGVPYRGAQADRKAKRIGFRG